MHLSNKTYRLVPPQQVTCNDNPLPPCNEIYNHSPDGFSWGYSGSGPAQLALAVMVNEFGPDLNVHPIHYQDLKRDLIGTFPPDLEHTFTTNDVINCIQSIIGDYIL